MSPVEYNSLKSSIDPSPKDNLTVEGTPVSGIGKPMQITNVAQPLLLNVQDEDELVGKTRVYEDSAEKQRQRRVAYRTAAAFWVLGLINNSGYVIMMAGAKKIAPGGVGLVFLADVLPSLVTKLTAPYWFHLVPYSWRVWICSTLMVLSFVTVGYGNSTGVQLLGVAFSSLQGGLGEASFLALAAFYDTATALTAWSSGTGFAGVFGYAWVFFFQFIVRTSFEATLLWACSLALALLYTFFQILGEPDRGSNFVGVGVGTGDVTGGDVGESESLGEGDVNQGIMENYVCTGKGGWEGKPGLFAIGEEAEQESGRDETKSSWLPLQTSSSRSSLYHRSGERNHPGGSMGGTHLGNGCGTNQNVVGELPRAPGVPEMASMGSDLGSTRQGQVPLQVVMTVRERLKFTLGLWPYTLPLAIVYFAEYTMQTGAWSAIGFPVTSEDARQSFYQYANWSYQAGVFISRTSGLIFRLSRVQLWIPPTLQVLLLIFFCKVAVSHSCFWYDNRLLVPCFGAGLLGGLGYVNAFRLVAEAHPGPPKEVKELALAAASIGDSIGIVMSDIAGVFVQACIYKENNISGAWGTC